MQSLIFPLVLIAAMLFFMSRTQKKQKTRQEQMKNELKPGAEVVTIGGMHALVKDVDQAANTVDLDVEGVFFTFDITAIRTVKNAASPTDITPKITDQEAKPNEAAAEAAKSNITDDEVK